MATCDDAAENNTPRPKVLFPGEKILYKERYEYATFSGKVNSVGLTVGHIGDGESVELHDAIGQQVIAKIVKRIEGTVKTEDDEFTADISFLKMNSCCTVRNILRCSDLTTSIAEGDYRLVLQKDRILLNEPVMVLDENGFIKQGKITKSRFNCKANGTGQEVINALCIIGDNNHAIAQPSQSGVLVTSCPRAGSDVLRVYGIVTHVYESSDLSMTATIANRLWDVLRVYHCTEVRLGDTLVSIDFAED